MPPRPSTIRLRITEALTRARDTHERQLALHQSQPSAQTERELVRAKREVEILERRVVQVDSSGM